MPFKYSIFSYSPKGNPRGVAPGLKRMDGEFPPNLFCHLSW